MQGLICYGYLKNLHTGTPSVKLLLDKIPGYFVLFSNMPRGRDGDELRLEHCSCSGAALGQVKCFALQQRP